MERVCENCVFWDMPEHGGTESRCACPKLAYEVHPDGDGLAYWDTEDYSAGLATGPKFGCVHWEPKLPPGRGGVAAVPRTADVR